MFSSLKSKFRKTISSRKLSSIELESCFKLRNPMHQNLDFYPLSQPPPPLQLSRCMIYVDPKNGGVMCRKKITKFLKTSVFVCEVWAIKILSYRLFFRFVKASMKVGRRFHCEDMLSFEKSGPCIAQPLE